MKKVARYCIARTRSASGSHARSVLDGGARIGFSVGMRILVTRTLPIDPRTVAPAGIEVDVFAPDRPMSRDEIAARGAQADGIVSMLVDPFDAALLARLPALRVLANYAVGYDNIDVAAARARGIVVTNTPGVLTESTADLTMLLILSVARRAREAERTLRTGRFAGWSPTLLLGSELAGKTLGLFGYGRIGRAVAKRADAFGMRVIWTSRREGVDFETLLAQSDVLSLHAPLSAETRHRFDARTLARMKPGAILINTARGALLDEAALAGALEDGPLAGAGLDVFEREPAVESALLGRDDVVLLPHVGSATIEARTAMASMALANCFAVLEGKPPVSPV